MGIKLKTFLLTVDRPKPVYRPGETVSGSCLIDLVGQMNLSQLTIKLKGKAVCQWSESHTVRHGSDTRRETRRIYGKQICIEMIYSPGNVYPTVLNGGQHNIGFTFQLPNFNLPSSFEGRFGHIRYYLKANIHKTALFSFDDKTMLTIAIQSPAYVPIQELSKSVLNSNEKTVGIFGGKRVSMKCQINRMGYNLGTTIAINCFIDNQSKKTMTLKATLQQEVVFHADGRSRKTTDKIIRAIGGTISAHTQQTEVIPLLVPTNAPVVQNSCQIIKIEYVILVTLDIPGSFDLHCALPIYITNESLPFDIS